jgi:hypothetical protein
LGNRQLHIKRLLSGRFGCLNCAGRSATHMTGRDVPWSAIARQNNLESDRFGSCPVRQLSSTEQPVSGFIFLPWRGIYQ